MNNGWNSVWASGVGCIKIVDCTKNQFDSDIFRAKFCSIQDGKSGSWWEPSSLVELHEKFLAWRLALSVDVVRTSGPLKRGAIFHFK